MDDIFSVFELPEKAVDIRSLLATRINELIDTDFNKLITLLYRFDINEKKLKQKLADASNAGEVIADLIIEREEEKKAARQAFRKDDAEIPDDEKW
jgi:hypothetical protein